MATVVVPFRGAGGKSRLTALPREARAAIARAMLADVVAAARVLGPVFVVAPDFDLPAGAKRVADAPAGQGPAVQAGLEAALADAGTPPYLVVNADLPCATTADLLALAAAVPDGGLALAAAADGTTNALAFASATAYAPVYGPGSAARFAALAPSRVLELPNLMDDVDTVADLERLRDRVGPETSRALSALLAGSAA